MAPDIPQAGLSPPQNSSDKANQQLRKHKLEERRRL